MLERLVRLLIQTPLGSSQSATLLPANPAPAVFGRGQSKSPGIAASTEDWIQGLSSNKDKLKNILV